MMSTFYIGRLLLEMAVADKAAMDAILERPAEGTTTS
jgi:hypothetical protein